VPDREVTARLASLRSVNVQLERRLRGSLVDNPVETEDETYWRGEIDAWRGQVERVLSNYPIQVRAFGQPVPAPEVVERPGWEGEALNELGQLRARLDAIVERMASS
jgi:hypothetical protein